MGGDDDRRTFVQALEALQSHSTSSDDRKRANEWLLAFQRSSACWPVATQLLLDPNAADDVRLFASQTLKQRARLMRSAPADQVQQLQRDTLQVLSQLPPSSTQLIRQVCLALVDMSLPNPDTLGQLISHLTSNLPSSTALLAIEYLADGVSTLTHFGAGGSNEERVEALAHLKAKLRSHAGSLFAWLSSQAKQSMAPQDAACVLNCFNAWTRLGGLQGVIDNNNLESLVSLALSHVRQPGSEAFEASADALAEVIDCCQDDWLGFLQESLLSLVDVAVGAASSGQVSAAEHICRVVAGYAALRIINALPPVESCRPLFDCLMRLARMSEVADSGDPVCWPALKAWVDIVDAVLGTGLDEFDQDEEDAEPQFQTASSALAAAEGGHPHREVLTLLDQQLVNLLQTMVAWQRPDAESDEVTMDSFTPAFVGTLMDFFAAACDVVGPVRFTSLLCIMVEQQFQQSGSDYVLGGEVAATAMHAVSAAGRRRLSAEADSRQMLSLLMQKAASMASSKQRSKALLMPFCCAAASTGRAVLAYMSSANQKQEAEQFIASTLDIALEGLSLRSSDHDAHDVQTPAATAIKSVMQGSKEEGLPVPSECIQALVTAVRTHTQLPPLAESSLVLALSCAVLSQPEQDGTRQRIQLESMQQLVQPLQTLLGQVLQQRTQELAMPEGTDEQLRALLRQFELLLESALQPEGEEYREFDQSPPAKELQTSAQMLQKADKGALSWLSDTFLGELWPKLSQVVTKDDVSGVFLPPLCKSLAMLLRALPGRCQESLPSIVQAMVNCMFRSGGLVAHQPLSVALEVYGSDSQCQQLLQQAVQHILTEPRVAELGQLGAADQQPELAECCAKVSSSYVRHLWPAIALRSAEAAKSSAAAIARLTAACTCSNHRGASLASLACSADIVGAAVGAAKAAHASREQQQQAEVVAQAVLDNGSMVCMGIIGGLLSSLPLSRLHKSATILAELALLAGASRNAVAESQQHQLLVNWLSDAAGGCQLPEGEKQYITQTWPSAILEAASGLSGSSKEQGLACRSLKKLLRDFADAHSRAM